MDLATGWLVKFPEPESTKEFLSQLILNNGQHIIWNLFGTMMTLCLRFPALTPVCCCLVIGVWLLMGVELLLDTLSCLSNQVC